MIKQTYLSEATREVDFKYGRFNHIDAPTGSGKTTYVADKLTKDLNNMYGKRNGLTVLLAPYNMLEDQVDAEGLFDKAKDRHLLMMQGFIFFDDRYTREDIDKLSLSKIVMTPHRFFNMMKKEKETGSSGMIIDSIDTLIIDESDHVFCRLPIWEMLDNKKSGRKGKNKVTTFKYAASIIMENIYDVMVVSISATGEQELQDIFGAYYNDITFKEKLKGYTSKSNSYYSDVRLAFNEAIRHGGKVGVFTESVRNMIKQRKYFESLGYKVDMIVSDYAKNYSMTSREVNIKEDLAKTGESDKVRDILIFNATMERGVSIHDKSFSSIIVHSSKVDTQTQVVGRFRFDGIRVWRLLDDMSRERKELRDYVVDKDTGRVTNEIIVPSEYMGVSLTTPMKSKLIEEIGYSRKWTSLKRVLVDNGYAIQDKRTSIDGVSTRVSIITK